MAGIHDNKVGCGYVDVVMKGDWDFVMNPVSALTDVRRSVHGELQRVGERCDPGSLDFP